MNTTEKQLARIDDLTRRYARYSRSQAGLSAAWGGLCIALFGGLILGNDLTRFANHPGSHDLLGFWRFLRAQGNQAPSPLLSLLALALPTLWLLGRAWIQRRVYERDGKVVEKPTPLNNQIRQFLGIMEIYLACILIPGEWINLALEGFPAALIPGVLLSNAIMVLLAVLGRRMVSFQDRSALIGLFLGSAGVLAGGAAEAVLGMMIAYAVLGVIQMVLGSWSHWQFLRVKRELDVLDIEAPVPPRGTDASSAEQRSFAPRVLPRDARDGAVTIAIGILQVAGLFFLPAFGVFLLTHSWIAATCTAYALFAMFLSFTVEKLTVGRDGIRFHRLFGAPKFLAWERIVSVHAVPAAELIWRGWIWPPFPPRESSICMTAAGHYRIDWDGGHRYFPPADAQLFETCVAAMWPQRKDGTQTSLETVIPSHR